MCFQYLQYLGQNIVPVNKVVTNYGLFFSFLYFWLVEMCVERVTEQQKGHYLR